MKKIILLIIIFLFLLITTLHANAIVYDFIIGKPVQTDNNNFKFIIGKPYIIINGTVSSPPTDTCTCPSIDTNWLVAMSDKCVIETCDIGTGNLTFDGSTGYFNITGVTLDVSNIFNLTNGKEININSTGIINLG